VSASVHVQLDMRDEAAARGIATVLAHTPGDVRLVLAGPGAGDARAWLAALAGGERLRPAGHSAERDVGDIAIVDARTCVPPGWLGLLQAAAQGVPGPVATVSPLALGAGPTALGSPSGDAVELDAAAAAVRGHAAQLRPRVPAPSPACMLVARAALELVGPLDEGFPERCSAAGLLHIVADDVLVVVHCEPAEASAPLPEEHEWQRDQEDLEPIGRARALARRAVDGLSVTIDGRALSGSMAGTQVHALELTAALHRTGALRLRIVVPPDLLPEAQPVFAALEGLEILPALGIDQMTPRSEIVHRPYQVSSAADAKLLRRVARRRVITHQDLLGYHNPSYHPSASRWEAHRRLTRAALAAADLVITFSNHVASDLLAEDLVDPARVEVVHIGVDHRLPGLAPPAAPPERSDPLMDGPFVVCLGTGLRHKNRPFALALLGALRDRGWEGRLALAGTPPAAGGSQAAETAWLDAHPEHGSAVVDLGPVDESGKAWLYEHAAAALYPTVSEGFGLIPFEAADAGTPCLHAGGSALDELLPGSATLVPWDAAASAERVLAVLRDPRRAAALVGRVADAGAELTWDRTAERLVTCYESVLRRPASPAAFTAWTSLAAEDRLAHFEGLHGQLVEAIGPTGLSLVGYDRLLPEDAQRTLAGLARRPLTRKPLLRVLSGLHRVAARDPSR
jgi:glycosyltransferase involved in cell wall biosynthesis